MAETTEEVKTKKKMKKSTIIVLCALALVVLIVLAIVLMFVIGNAKGNSIAKEKLNGEWEIVYYSPETYTVDGVKHEYNIGSKFTFTLGDDENVMTYGSEAVKIDYSAQGTVAEMTSFRGGVELYCGDVYMGRLNALSDNVLRMDRFYSHETGTTIARDVILIHKGTENLVDESKLYGSYIEKTTASSKATVTISETKFTYKEGQTNVETDFFKSNGNYGAYDNGTTYTVLETVDDGVIIMTTTVKTVGTTSSVTMGVKYYEPQS